MSEALQPGICRICGCTDEDACFDEATERPCSWVGPECDVCSRCARLTQHPEQQPEQRVEIFSEHQADLYLQERRRYGI